MPLKPVVTKDEFSQLPEALQGLYAEKNGKFVLDIEGIDDPSNVSSALKKEREAKAELERTLRQIREQLGDADPAKAREAVKKLQELEDKKLIDEGKVEELLKSRTERLVQDYDGKLKEKDARLSAAEKQLAELVIDNALRQVATRAKVRDTAVEDFLRRGREVYRLKDGKAVPMKGEEVLFGKKPNEPMSMEEWAESLAPQAPHLFEGSGGSGASNMGGGGQRGPYTITAAQAKDMTAYKAAKAAAETAGQPLQIVEG
jgi:hypothetical protein